MFTLDKRLEAESFILGDGPLSCILLKDDCRFPWFIVVPRLPHSTELYELTPSQQRDLMQEITHLSMFLKETLGAHKLNIAALGNKVPQLHIHVIGRTPEDAAWPEPVWGVRGAIPYHVSEVETLKKQVEALWTDPSEG